MLVLCPSTVPWVNPSQCPTTCRHQRPRIHQRPLLQLLRVRIYHGLPIQLLLWYSPFLFDVAVDGTCHAQPSCDFLLLQADISVNPTYKSLLDEASYVVAKERNQEASDKLLAEDLSAALVCDIGYYNKNASMNISADEHIGTPFG